MSNTSQRLFEKEYTMMTRIDPRFTPRQEPSGSGHHSQPISSDRLADTALDCSHGADCLLIKTANSTYAFLITDPVSRRGILMGGALGASHAASVLLGAEIGKSGDLPGLLSELCDGSRAIFFAAAPDGVKRLITSPITKLVLTRAMTK
jgi:hypothetical protein